GTRSRLPWVPTALIRPSLTSTEVPGMGGLTAPSTTVALVISSHDGGISKVPSCLVRRRPSPWPAGREKGRNVFSRLPPPASAAPSRDKARVGGGGPGPKLGRARS